MAKWLPSINASSAAAKAHGKEIASKLGFSEREYRKLLSTLRERLDVMEHKMSARQFTEIIYPHVPSRANLIYRNAFLAHDSQRRKKYLASLAKGGTKIHSVVLFTHEIANG